LKEKIEASPKRGANSIGADDLKGVWISKTDTAVKACINGMVTVILHDGDGKWELMFTHEEYTFWYSGLSGLGVGRGQKIKEGETVGYVKKGEKVILQMMNNETSIDPKEFLECER
jgi:murein DD-endopeptidase MepM/ murein hydrolase activator NlpD